MDTRFVRAGYLVIQERNSSNSVTNSYVWDSVSPGGIGGLLELTQGGAHYDYLYDGKGNVAALTDSGQNVVAAYRYDGFGVLKAKSGTLDQPYQFSTKRYYAALGMVKYEYRDYLPVLGKWAERDPLGEASDVNLYRAMGNSVVNFVDTIGFSGNLYIASSTYGGGSLGGHSWIVYVPDDYGPTSYGTWGNNPDKLGNGLHENLEIGRQSTPEAWRGMHINNEQEAKLYKLIQEYRNKGENGWKASAPCSTFAHDAWQAATNEDLSPYYGPLSNPEALKESIIDSNGGSKESFVNAVNNNSSSPPFGSSLGASGYVSINPIYWILQ